MYKARIKKWGLDKKCKEHEARAVLQMHARRRGKATRMRLRGQSVDLDVFRSYFRRKGVPLEDVLAAEPITISDLVCETPVASPRMSPRRSPSPTAKKPNTTATPRAQSVALRGYLWHLRSPEKLRAAESLFAGIEEYVWASYGTGRWTSQGFNTYSCPSGAPLARSGAYKLLKMTQAASSCFDRKSPTKAIRRLDKGFAYIETIVRKQPWEALPYLLRATASLLVRHLEEAVLRLCQRLCRLASELESSKDRITGIFRDIFHRVEVLTKNDEASGYLLAALSSWAQSHTNVLGPNHLRTFEANSMLTRITCVLRGPTSLLDPLATLHRQVELEQGAGSLQSVLVLSDWSDCLLACGKSEAAEGHLQQIVLKTAQAARLPGDHRVQANNLQRHARERLSCIRELQRSRLESAADAKKAQALNQKDCDKEQLLVMASPAEIRRLILHYTVWRIGAPFG